MDNSENDNHDQIQQQQQYSENILPLPPLSPRRDQCIVDVVEGQSFHLRSDHQQNPHRRSHYNQEQPMHKFIAVRRGIIGDKLIQNCLFSNWNDAKLVIQNTHGHETSSEYELFHEHELQKAIHYLFGHESISNNIHHPYDINANDYNCRNSNGSNISNDESTTLVDSIMQDLLPSNDIITNHQLHQHQPQQQHGNNHDPSLIPPQLQEGGDESSTHDEQRHHDNNNETRNHYPQQQVENSNSINTNDKTTAINNIATATKADKSNNTNTKRRIGSKIKSKANEKFNTNWDHNFHKYENHIQQFGHDVPIHQNDSSLSKWVNQQKKEYRILQTKGESKLSPSQLQRLNDVGFKFTSRKKYGSWSDRMKEFIQYREKNGHGRVPVSHPTLGSWVHGQRRQYKLYQEQNPKSTLTDARVSEMKNAGFVFEVAKKNQLNDARSHAKSWNERYEELKDFKARYGHTVVPQNYPNLGWWVNTQRKVSRGIAIMIQI